MKGFLAKARQILVERGVNHDGWYVNKNTGREVCSVGALFLANGATVESGGTMGYDINEVCYPKEVADAEAILESVLPEKSNESPTWNVRTFNDSSSDEEVLALFDRAIASLT